MTELKFLNLSDMSSKLVPFLLHQISLVSSVFRFRGETTSAAPAWWFVAEWGPDLRSGQWLNQDQSPSSQGSRWPCSLHGLVPTDPWTSHRGACASANSPFITEWGALRLPQCSLGHFELGNVRQVIVLLQKSWEDSPTIKMSQFLCQGTFSLLFRGPWLTCSCRLASGLNFCLSFFAKLRVGSGISYMLNCSPVSMGSALPLVIKI